MNQLKMKENEKIHLYGLSYGSYLVHRFLQIYPSFVDSVVFDGIAPPQTTEFLKYDVQSNSAGIELLNRCDGDEYCGKMMNGSYFTMRKVFDGIERGNICPPATRGLTRRKLRNIMFILLRAREEETQILILAVIFRLLRCQNRDIKALARFFGKFAKKDMSYKDYTQLVYANIGVGEMSWNGTDPIPSLSVLRHEQDSLFFSADLSLFSRYLMDIWPKYRLDSHYNRFAVTKTPFLMIQGDIDPQTILSHASFLFNRIRRTEHQNLVVFENYQHRVIARDFSDSCSFNMVVEFMKRPFSPINRTCSSFYNLDFKGITEESRKISLKYFGVENLWDPVS